MKTVANMELSHIYEPEITFAWFCSRGWSIGHVSIRYREKLQFTEPPSSPADQRRPWQSHLTKKGRKESGFTYYPPGTDGPRGGQ